MPVECIRYLSKEELEEDYIKHATKFTLNFYLTIIKRRNELLNIVFSPFLLQSLFLILYLGSKSPKIDNEIVEILQIRYMWKDVIVGYFKELLDFYTANYPIKIAQKIYIQDGIQLKPYFHNYIENCLHTKIGNVNFFKLSSAIAEIDEWILLKTDKQVKNILFRDPKLKCISNTALVSAAYIKFLWGQGNNTLETKKREFWFHKDYYLKINMMFITAKLKYGVLKNLDAVAVELLDTTCNLGLVIVLPNQYNGLKHLENTFDYDFIRISSLLHTTTVRARIPKFRIQFRTDVFNVLKMFGAQSIFAEGIFPIDASDKTKNPLSISSFVHKVCFELDIDNKSDTKFEEAEAIQHSLGEGTVEFNVDHPFLFYVWDRKTILLFGRFCIQDGDI